jgi:tetratricopeptide (TPR) repeat protein
MPRRPVQDVTHGMLTDHEIAKAPKVSGARRKQNWRLQAFSAAQKSDRELGLAYAEVSLQTGDSRQGDEAFRLLNPLFTASKRLIDKDVGIRLAGLYQQRGDRAKAAELYESVLVSDPDSIVSLVNLGNYYGSRGVLAKALSLWRRALARNPCQVESAANLKQVYLATGDLESARTLESIQNHCVMDNH